MVWLIGFGLFCVLIIVLLLTKIYVTVNYSFINDKQQGSIHIYLLKIPLYRKDIRSDENKHHSFLEIVKNADGFSDLLQEVKFFLKTIKETTPSISWVLKKLSIHKLHWHTNVGAGEASSTGMLSGGVWSIKGLVIAFLREASHVACSFHVNVIPYFQHKLFNSEIDMKFSIRVGHAILGGLKILRSLSKQEEITIKLRERKI
ncbi:DUF2953 domain-containing protein [Virgibacillus necropolis]|uniref:DUF2953 domain-containing protein n=1 Tax=Virgibacillus necropolis TaxID=163877 RepID=UPI00384BF9F4